MNAHLCCRKLLTRHYDPRTLNALILRGGNRLLVLTATELQMRYLVGLRLRTESIVLKRANFLLVRFIRVDITAATACR